MYEEMNMGKGFMVPPGNEALLGGYWMETPNQGSLPIDCLETLSGSSNWQGILGGDGAPYSQPQPQPLVVQNHNTAFHDFNGSGQASLPGMGTSSSGIRNGGLNQIHEVYPQTLNVDDGPWSGSWDQLLSLMKAPSALPENFMANRSMGATNDHARMPNPGNQHPRPLMRAPQRNGSASSSVSVEATTHLLPTNSQGSNMMQPPCVGTWNGTQNKSLNAYSHESSYQMQPSVASSTPLDQSHYITSIQRQSKCLPNTMQQEGFPVFYDPHYNLNRTHVDAPSSITSSSHFAPQTPQPAKRSHHQYSAEMVLSLAQSQNQYNALQDDLAISGITQSSHFAPATPQPAKAADNYQSLATQCLSIDQFQKQGKVLHETLPGSLESESTTHDCQELLQSILDSSSTAIGTSLRETNGSEVEENQNIDLNKTPPKKTPRRKKHRPKVIVEKKPPRNRKPAKEKVGLDGTPVPKRKYVRKNKSNPIETPEQDVGEKPEDPTTTERASKFCRRSLNFELEDNVIGTTKLVDQEEKQNETQENIFQNVIGQEADNTFQNAVPQQPDNIFRNVVPQEPGPRIGSNHSTGINSAQRFSQRNVQIQGNKEAGITTSLPPSIHQLQKETHQSSQHMLGTHPVMRNWQTDKSYTSTSNEAKGATALCNRTVNGYQIPGHHPVYAVGQTLFQEMTPQERLERTRRTIEQIQQQRMSEYIQSRGSKRDYVLAKEHGGSGHSTITTKSPLLSQEIFQNEHIRANSRLDQCYSGAQKRKRIENLGHTANSSIQYSARFAHNCSSQGQMNGYPVPVDRFLGANGGLFNSYHRSNTSVKPNGDLRYSSSELNPDPASPCINLLRQSISSEACLGPEKIVERQARITALARVMNSLNAQAYPNVQNQMPSNHVNSRTHSLAAETTNRSSHVIVPIKKQNVAAILPKPLARNRDEYTGTYHVTTNRSSHAIVPTKKQNAAPILPKPVARNRGPNLKQKNTVSVDDITDQLKCLNLNSTNNGMMKDEQKALVLYKADGTIVPYEGFDLLKRRKPRPKVDLDPETNRLWNLLMGKEAIHDENQTDEQKTKWWEEQRKMFRGRADSFIARMHLVQGDRRFSPWKGSVVDSVIGVFLTQNVTDHLSSSAFMCLAANFPSQSVRRNIARAINGLDVLVEEPHICMLETNDKIQRDDRLSASVECIQTSVIANNQSVDELVSSQDSAESSNVCINGAVQSLFMSDLRADCPTNGYQSISRYSKMSFIVEEMENLVRFPNIASQESGGSCYKTAMSGHLQLQNAEASQQKQLDGSYPFDLNRPQLPAPNISSSSCQFPAPGGLRLSDTDNGNMLRNQHCISLHSTAASKNMGVTRTGTGQDAQGNTALFHNEKTWAAEPATENSYILQNQSNSAAENGVCIQNKSVESNLKEQDCSSTEASSRTKTNVSKEKGRKTEGVKKTTVDWDCLRRQVKSLEKERERSQYTMNSIDYDALRSADVKKISDVIKERGMNNMLAERMKDFLDRLVRDHGSVDLEWLRDAPPDKAKDYLLSIRGLGLKSVECIRLLTLHQHAFPVDTNVGRIAVRLGWVPLQPLPESLQLHLLEMYPMLESIQKYLYPRLLNLDQRTLYELHYQLITFGKVFCTKSKPNCNACPMRGECRHFASAFASSRLALPGPEEKSIVTSNTPIDTRRNPSIGVCPLPLPSLQDVKPEDVIIAHRTCEPIVEEPTTPEPEITEFSDILDIEEAFYEDPDEIPTIRLNVEEFTQNLQNFMQENMELQESDMSKALVSFDPKAASIPTPKLKNVSRLRTEHQVYQLPDSHPLLKGLDRREADDPSPYLLAIWTPGETPNSIQPPEGICNFQESGQLCSENACFTCNSIRESNAQTVRGTLLVPCRTAMRGSFPLNGTYFQVNEIFADHESSLKPIDVPREMIWNLPRRTVYFGTSVSAIFKGMSTEDIQQCFWRGYVCVRGFDQKTRLPRPLMARLHFSANKQMRGRKEFNKMQNN